MPSLVRSPSVPQGLLRTVRPCVGVVLALALGCDKGEDKPSLQEALSTRPEDQFVAKDPKPRPDDKAWDRKDPEGEKHLYKWDKANLDKMMNYWEDLTCFKEKMKAEGQKAFGAEPGSPTAEEWYQFKQAFVIPILDSWQKRLFANEPRILEKTKFIGNFLEAHELISREYPAAYNDSDNTALEKADAHWMIVEAKIKKYVGNLGGKFPEVDLDNAKSVEKHAKHCAEALKPPDTSGKAKKRTKKKGPI
jgi:hypothetical protein